MKREPVISAKNYKECDGACTRNSKKRLNFRYAVK